MSALTKYEDQGQQSLAELQLLAETAAKSKCYGNKSKEEIVMLLLTARDLGISTTQAINGGFWIVQGKIIMSAIQMATMVRKAGHSIRFGEVTEKSCTLIGKRRDNSDTLTITFNMAMAERAGLLKNPTWKSYPEDMLYSNAIKRLCRMLFPDVIGNAYDEYSMDEVIQKDKKWKEEQAFDCNTIEVENAIPKLEQKPADPVISHTGFHNLVEESGTLCNPDDLLEYVAYVANAQGKTPHQVMGLYAESNQKTLDFTSMFLRWLKKKEVVVAE